ncbi:MAG: hypothetical protein H6703_01100 [Myxococcales bacterium]|nr:hypothetical protein [Myxococcales bacterium]MCB9541029.1 hypothetical protein [Myxococcales bacterium]MCB9554151.1 hypothetical protein [Myxococcales bacterium]
MRRMLLIAAAVSITACGGAEEKLRDPDEHRHQAKPLPLNKVMTDSLTWDVDKSDWKIFHVETGGLVYVTVHFDKPGGKCEVYLRDRYGAQMAREVQSNNPYVELVRRVPEPTRIFVWVNSTGENCSTQYSLEARIEPD